MIIIFDASMQLCLSKNREKNQLSKTHGTVVCVWLQKSREIGIAAADWLAGEQQRLR